MSIRKPRTHTSEFKAKVALEMIRGDLTINELSKKYGVHATQINRWKQQALEGIKTSFNGRQGKVEAGHQKLIDLFRNLCFKFHIINGSN